MTPREIQTARYFAWVAATLFALGAAFSIAHIVVLARLHGFSLVSVFDIAVALVWTLAAVAMGAQIGRLAFFPVLGAWIAVIYGFVMSMGMMWPGLPFIASGVLIMYLGAKSAPLFRNPPQLITDHL